MSEIVLLPQNSRSDIIIKIQNRRYKMACDSYCKRYGICKLCKHYKWKKCSVKTSGPRKCIPRGSTLRKGESEEDRHKFFSCEFEEDCPRVEVKVFKDKKVPIKIPKEYRRLYNLVVETREILEEKQELDKEYKSLRIEILDELEELEETDIILGDFKVMVGEYVYFDRSCFKEEEPELYEVYLTSSPKLVIRKVNE